MAASGQDQFTPQTLNDRCPFGQATFGKTLGNGRDAPITVIRWTAIEPPESTPKPPFARDAPLYGPAPQPTFMHWPWMLAR